MNFFSCCSSYYYITSFSLLFLLMRTNKQYKSYVENYMCDMKSNLQIGIIANMLSLEFKLTLKKNLKKLANSTSVRFLWLHPFFLLKQEHVSYTRRQRSPSQLKIVQIMPCSQKNQIVNKHMYTI